MMSVTSKLLFVSLNALSFESMQNFINRYTRRARTLLSVSNAAEHFNSKLVVMQADLEFVLAPKS